MAQMSWNCSCARQEKNSWYMGYVLVILKLRWSPLPADSQRIVLEYRSYLH